MAVNTQGSSQALIEQLQAQVKEFEKEFEKLNNRIANLEGWNKEMYDNHTDMREKLKRVYKTGLRMRKTAVVDDDFPGLMADFDAALTDAKKVMIDV